MKKRIQGIIIGIVIGVLIGSVGILASTRQVQETLNYNNIKILLDGEELIPRDVNGNYVEPFIIDGTTYLPVRGISNALGLDVDWDGKTQTVLLTTPDDDISGILAEMLELIGIETNAADTTLKFSVNSTPEDPAYINVILPNDAMLNAQSVITEIQTNGLENFKEGDLGFHFDWNKEADTLTVKISPNLIFEVK